jgi:hypothetical protein
MKFIDGWEKKKDKTEIYGVICTMRNIDYNFNVCLRRNSQQYTKEDPKKKTKKEKKKHHF